MTPVTAKASLLIAAALMLAQPALAQTTEAPPPVADMRPYSEVEAEQRAYEQGRADEAADRAYAQGRADEALAATPPPEEDPAYRPVQYDGYCYQRQAHAQTTGTIVGAVAGALIGNSVSHRWNRGSNTIGGAMVGGMLGSAVGRDSVKCYQGAYYAYDDGYYAPPPPPRGYVTVYFGSRPSYGYYNRVYGGHHDHHRRHW